MSWDGNERRQGQQDLSMTIGQIDGRLASLERTYAEHTEREEKILSELFDKVNELALLVENLRGQMKTDAAEAEAGKWKLLAAMIAASGGVGAAASKLMEMFK